MHKEYINIQYSIFFIKRIINLSFLIIFFHYIKDQESMNKLSRHMFFIFHTESFIKLKYPLINFST